ncbi:MAG: MarR family transcriptional regulator [Endomicrobium sp.]|jgi:DNA-binding MarR family transcriptional regulator|nr:MarR family transcriptional regulator [Endomicrobium sp.]
MDWNNDVLSEKFMKLQYLLHKMHLQKFADEGPMGNPVRGQGRILTLLKKQDGISTKDMSFLLDIRISSLNDLLSKLEKSGYITRKPSPEDKRVMLVKLTQKGKSEKSKKSTAPDIFGCLSEKERENLGKYLDKVIEVFSKEVGDKDDDEKMAALKEMHEKMGAEKLRRLAGIIKHNGVW